MGGTRAWGIKSALKLDLKGVVDMGNQVPGTASGVARKQLLLSVVGYGNTTPRGDGRIGMPIPRTTNEGRLGNRWCLPWTNPRLNGPNNHGEFAAGLV